MQTVVNAILNLIWPTTCLHCDTPTDDGSLLCRQCTSHLSLLPKAGRCPLCFATKVRYHCSHCKGLAAYGKQAACFNSIGPGATLAKQILHMPSPKILKIATSYLVYQLLELNWPIPDCVMLAPTSVFSRFSSRYQTLLELCRQVGQMLNRPACRQAPRSPKTLLFISPSFDTPSFQAIAKAMSPNRSYGLSLYQPYE